MQGGNLPTEDAVDIKPGQSDIPDMPGAGGPCYLTTDWVCCQHGRCTFSYQHTLLLQLPPPLQGIVSMYLCNAGLAVLSCMDTC